MIYMLLERKRMSGDAFAPDRIHDFFSARGAPECSPDLLPGIVSEISVQLPAVAVNPLPVLKFIHPCDHHGSISNKR